MQVSCKLVDQASRASKRNEHTSLVQNKVAESPKVCEIEEWRVPLATQKPHNSGRRAFYGEISTTPTRLGQRGEVGQPCRPFLHV